MKLTKRGVASFAIIIALFTVLFPCASFAADDLLYPYFNVGIAKYNGAASVRIDSNAVNVYDNLYGSPVYSFQSGSGFALSLVNGQTALSGDSGVLCSFEPMFIQSAGGLTNLGGIQYRGFIKPIRHGAGIAVVNVIDAEQYLYGVVPAEMPALWGMEALKAQAVVSRTYLYMQLNLNRHSGDGYDICDTVHCQYYLGASRENERSTEAVNQTAGIMAYYNGEIAETVFASSSGGHTENSENVWTNAVPYLRGVREIAENEFLEWSRSYTLDQLGQGLAAKGVNIGSVVSVTAEYLPSGRVRRLTFNGTNGTKTYEGDAVRGVTSELDGSLPSSLFKINGSYWSEGGVWDGGAAASGGSDIYILSSSETALKSTTDVFAAGYYGAASRLTGSVSALGSGGAMVYKAQGQNYAPASSETKSFTITSGTVSLQGRGNGHGVGMSQYGAKGMAEAGYDFISILKHYFTGIDIH